MVPPVTWANIIPEFVSPISQKEVTVVTEISWYGWIVTGNLYVQGPILFIATEKQLFPLNNASDLIFSNWIK